MVIGTKWLVTLLILAVIKSIDQSEVGSRGLVTNYYKTGFHDITKVLVDYLRKRAIIMNEKGR